MIACASAATKRCARLGAAGLRRVPEGGHDVVSRERAFLHELKAA